MSNTSGQASALTVLCPVHPDRIKSLRETLATLPLGEGSPLGTTGTTHFARWVIIEQFIDEGDGQKRDTLSCPYLLFTSNFDGPTDGYLSSLCTVAADSVHAVWSNCVGYPQPTDTPALVSYLMHNRIDTTMFYAAYPRATVAQVLRSLEQRDRFIAFAVGAQDMDANTLTDAFRSAFPAERW